MRNREWESDETFYEATKGEQAMNDEKITLRLTRRELGAILTMLRCGVNDQPQVLKDAINYLGAINNDTVRWDKTLQDRLNDQFGGGV